jgi:type II secretion system protein H
MRRDSIIIAPGQTGRGRGFTLVEILCVVVILGIIATVVGVSIGTRDDLKVQAASRVLSADLQYAQSRAVVRREPHYVTIGTSSADLRLALRSGGAWSTLTHPIDRKEFKMVFGASGSGGGQDVVLKAVDFGGNDVFGFDETGTPFFCDKDGNNRVEASTVATLTLAAGEHELVVSIQPITGEISISE